MSIRLSCALLVTMMLAGAGLASAGPATLSNTLIRVEFGPRGITSITDSALGASFGFSRDEFAIVLDKTRIDSASLPVPSRKIDRSRVTYTWTSGPYLIDLVYELRPGWRFVSKQIVVAAAPSDSYNIDEITVFRAALDRPVKEVYLQPAGRQNLGLGSYAAALRMDDTVGLLALAQNPFLDITHDGGSFSVSYAPDMEWKKEYGAFAADRGLLAPYRLTGRRFPATMLPEWRMGEPEDGTGMDEAESEAFMKAVRAFLLYQPERPLNLFVAWCVNDYQIDIATEAGRTEYKRILDSAAELGAEHVLFAPTNSDLGKREESVDDWNWENLLWLGLGQKIRRNEWDPRTGPMPATVQEMLDHAKSRDLQFLAYVYPILAFEHDPSWLVTRPNAPPGAKKYASLGYRSLQDWLIETLVAFHERTGISGYSFDHTFLAFDGPSRYAQWWGWRRVMEQLRLRIPDIVIDGRQAYHLYGPWIWLAGSFPHPTYSDEQPESFVPFPDLSFDRVSAARQRYTAYRFRNYDHAPNEIVPGFITHQTARNDDTGRMPQTQTEKGIMLDRFRPRDWDYLGWRYSLISSVATAGWNNVLNFIPARDIEEYENLSEEDKAWFRGWLDWTEKNKEYLRNTRTIMGQPAIGRADGTAAIRDGRGFVFLFNPNARRVNAQFRLDESIGLDRKGSYLLREIFPVEGRNIGKAGAGLWNDGDEVLIEMDGQSALVVEILPPPAERPIMFNLPGSASVSGGVLSISGVRGEVGTTQDLMVLLARNQDVASVRVNDRNVEFSQPAPGVVDATVTFDGTRFGKAQQVGAYDRSFTGGTFTGTFTVPQRVFDQLAAREEAWPIPWTPEDFRTPWLAPHRLLLYVQLAEPDHTWQPRLKIDGRVVELRKAYTAIRAAPRTFVGFYADLSLLSPDREYEVELELPELKPGQFQGLFFHNVEPDYTSTIRR
jgi:hypothetical protein